MSPFVSVSIVSLYMSIIISLFVIQLSKPKNAITDKKNTASKIGNLGIFLSFLIGSFLFYNILSVKLFAASLPIIVMGFLEDKAVNINPSAKISVFLFSAFAAVLSTGGFFTISTLVSIHHITYTAAFICAIFAILFITYSINEINIYENFASGFSLISLTVYAAAFYSLNDTVLFKTSLVLIFSVLGFFVLNLPKGKISLGRGGAYFLGFMLSALIVLAIESHPQISLWFFAALMIYPLLESTLSFYNRKTAHSALDKVNLYTAVYKHITHSHCMASLFIWIFILPFDILAFFVKNRTSLLIIVILMFIIYYVAIYKLITLPENPT